MLLRVALLRDVGREIGFGNLFSAVRAVVLLIFIGAIVYFNNRYRKRGAGVSTV